MEELRLALVRYAIVMPRVGPVLVRPIVAEDAAMAARAYQRLSPESRMQRFWASWKRLPKERLKDLTSPDGHDQGGWVLMDPSPEAEFGAFGAASFWRDRREPNRAEIFFTVGDAAQGQGLGTLLLAVLWIHAWRVGIDRFDAVVAETNREVAGWFERLGADVRAIPEGFEVELGLVKPAEIGDGAFGSWREPRSRHRLALCVRALLTQDELETAEGDLAG